MKAPWEKDNKTAIVLVLYLWFVLQSAFTLLYISKWHTCKVPLPDVYCGWLCSYFPMVTLPFLLVNRPMTFGWLCSAKKTSASLSCSWGRHQSWFWPLRCTRRMQSGVLGKYFKIGKTSCPLYFLFMLPRMQWWCWKQKPRRHTYEDENPREGRPQGRLKKLGLDSIIQVLIIPAMFASLFLLLQKKN